MDWAKLIEEGWTVITAYPRYFFGILALGLTIGWTAAWLILKNRLEHHKDLLDHYEKVISDKLPGTALKARADTRPYGLYFVGVAIIVLIVGGLSFIIATLQALPQARRLSASEQKTITQHRTPSGAVPYRVELITEAVCSDCPQYAAAFERALTSAGWIVTNATVMGISRRPPSGLAIAHRDFASPDAQLLVKTFGDANIMFDRQPMGSAQWQPQIIIAAR